ncbi:hypothetical protein DTO96_100639 [Ephemeroptericola cinctiostellae]|uniref:DUF4276 domain-containing protein n=1 Tax=Ephemeroptericola cinctiostellae TaxID=2268024 RepID=A0A345D985_9BURK|nr:DUF4276 family protein [Ephemeroptericola cinctiostellae]AXF84923.1 hypothetical protein DTO96_100639 [Ephemeroptericola cinctiostellae]
MHIEFLVEDVSGKVFLEHILGKFNIGTYKIHPYKGVGKLPKKGSSEKLLTKQHGLLSNLKKLLEGYGRSSAADVVFVVFDSDDKDPALFERELQTFYSGLNQPAEAIFSLAIEEMEAWLLGDMEAVMAAYPKAKSQIIQKYQQDSVCGTWEILARALNHKPEKLKWHEAGALKSEWADKITPLMVLDNNISPSFIKFRDELTRMESLI